MDCNLPGSSVHGIFQARIPKRVAISTPGDLSDAGIKPGFLAPPGSQLDSLPRDCQTFKKQVDQLGLITFGIPSKLFYIYIIWYCHNTRIF